jgi:DNA repair protein RadA/Sms
VNVTGGVRLVETGSDLAVAAALCSSLADRPLPSDALFIGEIGLGGEVRPIAALDRRISEAERLGFRRLFVSARNRTGAGVATVPLGTVEDLWRHVAA